MSESDICDTTSDFTETAGVVSGIVTSLLSPAVLRDFLQLCFQKVVRTACFSSDFYCFSSYFAHNPLCAYSNWRSQHYHFLQK